jgi:hypothetical protein
MTADLIDRHSRIKERCVPTLQSVIGVADIAAHFELDMSEDRAELVLLKNSGRLCPATVSSNSSGPTVTGSSNASP